jgi:hypothetical protein
LEEKFAHFFSHFYKFDFQQRNFLRNAHKNQPLRDNLTADVLDQYQTLIHRHLLQARTNINHNNPYLTHPDDILTFPPKNFHNFNQNNSNNNNYYFRNNNNYQHFQNFQHLSQFFPLPPQLSPNFPNLLNSPPNHTNITSLPQSPSHPLTFQLVNPYDGTPLYNPLESTKRIFDVNFIDESLINFLEKNIPWKILKIIKLRQELFDLLHHNYDPFLDHYYDAFRDNVYSDDKSNQLGSEYWRGKVMGLELSEIIEQNDESYQNGFNFGQNIDQTTPSSTPLLTPLLDLP